jgi:hypothetical protein
MPISRKKNFTPLQSDFSAFFDAVLAKRGKNGAKFQKKPFIKQS